MPYFYNERKRQVVYLNAITGEATVYHHIGQGSEEETDAKKDEGGSGDSAVEEVPKKRGPKPKKGQKVCKNCGEPGHMAKTCAAEAKEEDDGEEQAGDGNAREALSQDQYNTAKSSQSHGMSAEGIAGNMDVAVEEVEAAFGSRMYAHYKARRGLIK